MGEPQATPKTALPIESSSCGAFLCGVPFQAHQNVTSEKTPESIPGVFGIPWHHVETSNKRIVQTVSHGLLSAGLNSCLSIFQVRCLPTSARRARRASYHLQSHEVRCAPRSHEGSEFRTGALCLCENQRLSVVRVQTSQAFLIPFRRLQRAKTRPLQTPTFRRFLRASRVEAASVQD